MKTQILKQEPAQRLRWILGDQLDANHSWFNEVDPQTLYVIAELHQETNYIRHHVQKIVSFFASMEAFARQINLSGHRVLHLDLNQTSEFENLPELIAFLCKNCGATRFEYQRPDEYRLLTQLEGLKLPKKIIIKRYESEHFLLPFNEIPDFFTTGKMTRMENFYRKMRLRFDILIEDNEPSGGRWNFDAENRSKLKPADLAEIPHPHIYDNQVSAILSRLKKNLISYFGSIADSLIWPIDRAQSLELLEKFCSDFLPKFGLYQDAMTGKSEHAWSLYHSRISFSLNCKMLSPKEVIEAALRQYNKNPDASLLPQVEGFVRQILGWREYIRGMYWQNMPAYREKNYLNATSKLPDFFWTGKTKMRCVSAAINQSLEFSYAHYIQRLMVTGNFCLIAGIDPDQVEEWYLGIYIDAIEWVEMPNTRGMALFSDGGLIASKPYAASGNYINKMTDYCNDCSYKVKEKFGESACPLNSLYWHFMDRNRSEFGKNPRIGMTYRVWDKQDETLRAATLERAEKLLSNLNAL